MDSIRKKPNQNFLPKVTPTSPVVEVFSQYPPPLEPRVIPKFTPKITVSSPLQVKKRLTTTNKVLFFGGSFFLILLIGISALIWKGFRTVEQIQVTGNTVAAPTLAEKLNTLRAAFLPGELVALRGEERGRINILLLGKAGAGLPGENLTDTIMLASIDTKSKKVALLSLPRDLYVENRSLGVNGKINTLYQRNLKANEEPLNILKKSITLITGEPVDYFLVMDFSGFESVIDALGGIAVDVPKDFYDPRYPGLNYSYETFELKKGWQQLDGVTALKYVRERHDDPEGDFGRAKRQQQVLLAVKNKAQSPGTYLNFFRINKLFESVGQNVETDITLPEMQSFYELSKELDTQNITNQVIDAWKPESLLRVDHQILGGIRAFILVPRTGSWEETRDLSQNIFELKAIEERKEAIREEKASVLILDSGQTLASADKLARYIERELGIEARVRYTPQLDQGLNPAMLISTQTLSKPYSFDELLKRLPLAKGTTQPTFIEGETESDFILIMDSVLAESFQNEDEFYTEEIRLQKEFDTNSL